MTRVKLILKFITLFITQFNAAHKLVWLKKKRMKSNWDLQEKLSIDFSSRPFIMKWNMIQTRVVKLKKIRNLWLSIFARWSMEKILTCSLALNSWCVWTQNPVGSKINLYNPFFDFRVYEGCNDCSIVILLLNITSLPVTIIIKGRKEGKESSNNEKLKITLEKKRKRTKVE